MDDGRDLKELRDSIRGIDQEMTMLFEKRMALSRLVAAKKAKASLPIYDASREKENTEALVSLLDEMSDKPYFVHWYQLLMDISKKVQNEWVKRHGHGK
jgi:chorismate mutase